MVSISTYILCRTCKTAKYGPKMRESWKIASMWGTSSEIFSTWLKQNRHNFSQEHGIALIFSKFQLQKLAPELSRYIFMLEGGLTLSSSTYGLIT